MSWRRKSMWLMEHFAAGGTPADQSTGPPRCKVRAQNKPTCARHTVLRLCCRAMGRLDHMRWSTHLYMVRGIGVAPGLRAAYAPDVTWWKPLKSHRAQNICPTLCSGTQIALLGKPVYHAIFEPSTERYRDRHANRLLTANEVDKSSATIKPNL
jgi:hypothetical protein